MNDTYKPKETSDLQRYKWEDELNLAKREGYIPRKVCNTLLALSSQMNWAKHRGELRWSNEKACERAGISTATFYRNKPIMLKSGFLGHRRGNYHAKYPDHMEIIQFRIFKNKINRSEVPHSDQDPDPWDTKLKVNSNGVAYDPWKSRGF